MNQRKKIVLLGLPRSGKTTFLTMLSHFQHAAPTGSVLEREGLEANVFPADEETLLYLDATRDGLSAGTFPAATDLSSALALDIHLHGANFSETHTIEVPDIPGELCESELNTANPITNALIESLVECDGIVLLVDPAGLGAPDPRPGAPSTRPSRSARDPLQVFQHNFGMIYLALAHRLSAGPRLVRGRLPIPVSVVLTKAERFWSDPVSCRLVRRLHWSGGHAVRCQEPGHAYEHLTEPELDASTGSDQAAVERALTSYAPGPANLVRLVRQYFHRVSFHAVSAIGMLSVDGRWVPNLSLIARHGAPETQVEARVAAPLRMEPIGLLEPILALVMPPSQTMPTPSERSGPVAVPPSPVAPDPTLVNWVVGDDEIEPDPVERSLDRRRKASLAVTVFLSLSSLAFVLNLLRG